VSDCGHAVFSLEDFNDRLWLVVCACAPVGAPMRVNATRRLI
jgi:hypothetical protein